MRVWRIPPTLLCDKHLLGLHREVHCIWTFITTDKGGSYKNHPETRCWYGYEPELWLVHNEVERAMQLRGFKPQSPIMSRWRHKAMFGAYKPREVPMWQPVEQQIEILKAKGCQCRV